MIKHILFLVGCTLFLPVQDIGSKSITPETGLIKENDTDTLRALFIGNSYTFYNEMPDMVKALASSNGKNLIVKKVTHGGWTLKRHSENPETLDAIKEGIWDFVVLQEQSTAPAKEKDSVEKNVYPPALMLDSLRKEYNPGGKTVFYMTWGHNIETYETMQERLIESYLELTRKTNAWCAPVGIAWRKIVNEELHIQLYNPDKSHPSLAGSYLAANVFYTVFFQQPYQSGYYGDIPEKEALFLQQTAQEIVLNNLSGWNITLPVK